MQFTYRFTSRYTPCILQNSHYNHVKVNIATTKSPQFDSCTCLVGFTTIVFCFNLQNFSISQQSNQYVLIDPYMAPPKKSPKTMAFNTKSYEVMANSWMIWGNLPPCLTPGDDPSPRRSHVPMGRSRPGPGFTRNCLVITNSRQLAYRHLNTTLDYIIHHNIVYHDVYTYIGLLVVSNHPQLKVYCWVYRHYHGM
jgi:hypothetical protein